MPKLFKHLFLTTEDLGIDNFSTEEIAARMQPTSNSNEENLFEFASTVSCLFDENNRTINDEINSHETIEEVV